MIPTVGVDVLLSLADRLTAPLKDAENTIAKASERMNKRLKLSLKLSGGGAAAAGFAFGAQRLVTGFTNSIREVERAKGELATLGVKDLDAVVKRGYEMQTQLAGVTADAFVRASYDIKSGIASLTDQGVADMTAAAVLVAKATKGQAEQMTSLFATSYGIFKKQYAIMSDADFGNMFGAALSASVQQFKTDGAQMQQAIESAGATAVNLGLKMTEQLTILGMLQQQMQAGEAGTALRAFATNAAAAHEAFAALSTESDNPIRVRILDEDGQLRAMPDILTDLKNRYGETLDAFEAAEIKKAFGTDEAIKLINALYGQEEAVRANAEALEAAAEKGEEFTSAMAKAADSNWDAAMVLMSQKMDVLRQKIGQRLLPVFERLLPVIDAFMVKAFDWVDANPQLVAGIGAVVAGLGAMAAIVAPLLIGAGALVSGWGMLAYGATRLALAVGNVGKFVSGFGRGLLWLGRLVLPMVGRAIMMLGRALIMTPIGAVIAAIAGAAYLIYKYWEPISGFFQRLWGGLVYTFSGAVSWISDTVTGITGFDWSSLFTLDGLRSAWSGITGFLGQAFGTLWDMVNPLSWAGIVKSDDLASAWAAVTGFVSGTASKIWNGITGIEWSRILTLDGLRAAWISLTSYIGGVASRLWDAVTGIIWGDVISAPDWSQWLTFSWSDVLPDWDWGAIIPDLPDIKGMFSDAGETIDVRLENRASNLVGREWQEGVDLVNQYREGLIGIAELKTRLEEKASGGGMVFDGFEVNRAQDMLALLQKIEDARASTTAAPQIESPETLLQAAQAATELETRFPAITAAANEALMAVQAAINQIVTLVQGTDLTTEGARLANSIAAGIRGQIGVVSAAAAAMTAAIRNALPGSARVNVALNTRPAAVQARATGGWFKPGWLLTGEQGPELEYRSEGGFIAHNRALRGMLDMATRTREMVNGLGFDGAGSNPVPALATVAAAAGPATQRGPVTFSPQYNMPISFQGGVDMEEVRATVRGELMAAEERGQVELRRVMHD